MATSPDGAHTEVPWKEGPPMIGILIAILLAAVVYWLCVMLGLPAIVAIVAAILVLLAGVGTGGYGSRGWGGRRL
jgi:hypothetical protein